MTTEYDKDRWEDIGLLKRGLLGLRTLSVIQDALKMIKKNKGILYDTDVVNVCLKLFQEKQFTF